MSKEFKKQVLEKYIEWINQVSDDLEDKDDFSADEFVYKVVDLTLEELIHNECLPDSDA